MSAREENRSINVLSNYLSSILHSLTTLLAQLNWGHPIHPSEPVAPLHSKFFTTSSHRRIRLIHIEPEKNRVFNSKNDQRKSCRNSMSEEYWFTRWNRPLKICSCSFRRSQRFSTLTDEILPPSLRQSRRSIYDCNIRLKDVQDSNISNYDVPPTKITDVETFVERLIQDSLFEAFQEFYMRQQKEEINKQEQTVHQGLINLAYVGDDEIDSAVILRNKKPIKVINNLNEQAAVLQTDCTPKLVKMQNNQSTTVPIIKVNNNVISNDSPTINSNTNKKSKSCTHGNAKTKPSVMLLHGIGSTADIWGTIIDALLNKGFEVIAPDMLGHGFSSSPNSPKAYSFNNLLKDTLAIFDNFIGYNDNRKCIVIGHSFGCSLACALARYRAQNVVQLVLISGGGPTPLASPAPSNEMSIFSCMQTITKPLLFCGFKRTMFYSARGKQFGVCHSDTAVPSHVIKSIEEKQDWPEGDAVFHRRILIPTLLVHGLQDTQVTLVQECEMERTIPRAFLEIIPGAGHMAMLETPKQLCHMILCFVEWWSR